MAPAGAVWSGARVVRHKQRVFRNTFESAQRGCAALTDIVTVKSAHPLAAVGKLLRLARDLRRNSRPAPPRAAPRRAERRQWPRALGSPFLSALAAWRGQPRRQSILAAQRRRPRRQSILAAGQVVAQHQTLASKASSAS